MLIARFGLTKLWPTKALLHAIRTFVPLITTKALNFLHHKVLMSP